MTVDITASSRYRLWVNGKPVLSSPCKGDVIETITTGKAEWRVWLENSFFLKSVDVTCYLGAVVEEIDVSKSFLHWKENDFDISNWLMAESTELVKPTDILYTVVGVEPRFRIREREIPLLYERDYS